MNGLFLTTLSGTDSLISQSNFIKNIYNNTPNRSVTTRETHHNRFTFPVHSLANPSKGQISQILHFRCLSWTFGWRRLPGGSSPSPPYPSQCHCCYLAVQQWFRPLWTLQPQYRLTRSCSIPTGWLIALSLKFMSQVCLLSGGILGSYTHTHTHCNIMVKHGMYYFNTPDCDCCKRAVWLCSLLTETSWQCRERRVPRKIPSSSVSTTGINPYIRRFGF